MSNNRRSRTGRACDTDGAAAWTPEAVRALSTTTDIRTAAQIFGMALSTAYLLVKRGEFPVPVIRVGSHYRVPVAPILAALHVEPEPETDPP